jgi:hypothetical protein
MSDLDNILDGEQFHIAVRLKGTSVSLLSTRKLRRTKMFRKPAWIGCIVGAGFAIAGSAAFSCERKDAIYFTDFAADDIEWNLDRDTAHFGEKHLLVSLKPNTVMSSLYEADFFDRAEICADVTLVTNDNKDSVAGLVFWAKDFGHLYIFVISPKTGEFYVGKRVGSGLAYPVAKRRSDKINVGPSASNELKVVTNNKNAKILINGQEVATVNSSSWSEGNKIGLTTESDEKQTTWQFSDYSIKQLEGDGVK